MRVPRIRSEIVWMLVTRGWQQGCGVVNSGHHLVHSRVARGPLDSSAAVMVRVGTTTSVSPPATRPSTINLTAPPRNRPLHRDLPWVQVHLRRRRRSHRWGLVYACCWATICWPMTSSEMVRRGSPPTCPPRPVENRGASSSKDWSPALTVVVRPAILLAWSTRERWPRRGCRG